MSRSTTQSIALAVPVFIIYFILDLRGSYYLYFYVQLSTRLDGGAFMHSVIGSHCLENLRLTKVMLSNLRV